MDLTTLRELKHNEFSEPQGDLVANIQVKGTSYNANDTGVGYIRWINREGKQQGENVGGRGISLAILDHGTMDLVTSIRRYDVYGSELERDNLAKKLMDIQSGELGNVIYCMSSFDAIGTNSSLAEAMNLVRANHWFKLPGLPNGPTHRHPYAAIGTSRLGIIKEALHSNASGADAAYVTFSVSDDWDMLGAEGYGPEITNGESIVEINYASTGYGFHHKYFTIDEKGRNSLYDGEYVRMTGQQKVSLDRLNAGGKVTSYFWSASDTDGWIRSSAVSNYSVEWETFELFYRWDRAADTASGSNTGNAAAKYLRTGHYHMPSSIDTGVSSIRNIQIQRCGFKPHTKKPVCLQNNVMSARHISEHIGFKLGDATSYYNLWASDRNLTNQPNLGDSRKGSGFDSQDVRWFDRTLTARNEYSIHEGKNLTSDSNMYNDVGYVNIDSNKMYVGLIWMNCKEKTDGHNYFGTHTRSNGSTVPTYAYSGTGNTTNPYSQYPYHTNIEKDKWSLMSYWFLPHWFTDTQGNEFYSKNWCRAFGNYENGSADNLTKTLGSVGNNGGNIRVSRFKESDDQIHLRWLDFYNKTAQHKTWWALPGIYEVDPMDIQTQGQLHGIDIKEVSNEK
tara:strand:- start:237 stop:2093 length:1857 start_codon:yes stop_codon:yes gene_type:complete